MLLLLVIIRFFSPCMGFFPWSALLYVIVGFGPQLYSVVESFFSHSITYHSIYYFVPFMLIVCYIHGNVFTINALYIS